MRRCWSGPTAPGRQGSELPFFDFHANRAWANLAALAMNLVAWLQLAALPTSHTARGWDMKRWRYRLFATAGKLVTRAGGLAADP